MVLYVPPQKEGGGCLAYLIVGVIAVIIIGVIYAFIKNAFF